LSAAACSQAVSARRRRRSSESKLR
jgi:hypothetical protein